MRTVLLIVTGLFTVFTLAVAAHTGPIGFFEHLLSMPAGWQTLADVVISLSLVLVWMWPTPSAMAAPGGRERR